MVENSLDDKIKQKIQKIKDYESGEEYKTFCPGLKSVTYELFGMKEKIISTYNDYLATYGDYFCINKKEDEGYREICIHSKPLIVEYFNEKERKEKYEIQANFYVLELKKELHELENIKLEFTKTHEKEKLSEEISEERKRNIFDCIRRLFK